MRLLKQFHYLGESNAQLRDRACYFMNATTDEVKELVAYQGDFSKVQKLQEFGKLFGQSFTQKFALGDVSGALLVCARTRETLVGPRSAQVCDCNGARAAPRRVRER